jgi:6-phosphogluconolactonase (cycloisomerase 2 family)
MAGARRLCLVVVACIAVCAPLSRAAAPDRLALEDCFGNTGRQCALLPGSPLDDPAALAVSPDGKSVYVVSSRGNSIEQFSVGDARGHLRYAGCLNNDGAHGCEAVRGGPLNRPVAVEVSPDGKFVYVLSGGESIEEFAVAAGRLEYRGCQDNTGAHGCAALPGDPLDRPISLAVSPRSGSVYVMSTDTDPIGSFALGSGGRLAYAGCIGASAERGCTTLPRFRGVDHLVISPDGTSAYGIAWTGNMIEHFRVQQGELSFESCAGAGPGCTAVPGFPLQNPAALALSPDGRSVYVVSANGNWLAHFAVGAGALAYRGCYDNGGARGCQRVPGFPIEYPLDVAVSPDGKSLYVVSALASVAEFSVTGTEGELTYVSSPRGVSAPKGAVVSPNGTSLYVISGHNSVAQFVHGPSAPQLTARIVSASVLGRALRVRVQISEPADARLRLLQGRDVRLRRSFVLRAGTNVLRVPLGELRRGAYQLELTVTDAPGRQRMYNATVRIPRRSSR